MILYLIIEAAVGVIAGILLSLLSKQAQGVTYSKLDQAGHVTNILLIPTYVCLAPFYMFLGLIARPAYEGFLGIIGWIVAVVMASAALFCGVGLGLSVALRKQGRSKASFAVQFAGLAAILLTFALFFIFYGSLLLTVN